MPEITIQSAAGRERRVPLGPRLSIGRSTQSDVFVPDKRLSRRHAELQRRADGYWVVDLGSTNGTFLNGARIVGERPLKHQDVIALGETTLTFHDAHVAQRLMESLELEEEGVSDRTVALPDVLTRGTRRTLALRALGDGDPAERHRLLAVLGRATTELVQPLPLPALYARLVDVLLAALPADRAAILLADEGRDASIVSSRSRDGAPPIAQVSAELARRVMQGQLTLLLQDLDAEPALRVRESLAATGIRSVLCSPLWLRDGAGEARVIGLVYLDCRGRAGAFGDDDLQILTVLANLAAARIENARLVEHRVERAKLEEEMRLAAEIQATILPAAAPSLRGYDVTGATRSYRAVGGDYYDFHLEGDQLTFAIGDVSGKGVAAAMLMAALRTAVRSCWRTGPLVGVMEQVNETFRQCVPPDRFATFFLARLDVPSGQLSYVNAGHNHPLMVSATSVHSLAEGGTILGAFDRPSFVEGRAELQPGDTLLLFSDGISDAFEDAAEADARMTELARSLRGKGAAGVQKSIFDEVDRRAGSIGSRPADDRTLIVVQRG